MVFNLDTKRENKEATAKGNEKRDGGYYIRHPEVSVYSAHFAVLRSYLVEKGKLSILLPDRIDRDFLNAAERDPGWIKFLATEYRLDSSKLSIHEISDSILKIAESGSAASGSGKSKDVESKPPVEVEVESVQAEPLIFVSKRKSKKLDVKTIDLTEIPRVEAPPADTKPKEVSKLAREIPNIEFPKKPTQKLSSEFPVQIDLAKKREEIRKQFERGLISKK